MGGSKFEPWFGLGSYRWIYGEFSSSVSDGRVVEFKSAASSSSRPLRVRV